MVLFGETCCSITAESPPVFTPHPRCPNDSKTSTRCTAPFGGVAAAVHPSLPRRSGAPANLHTKHYMRRNLHTEHYMIFACKGYLHTKQNFCLLINFPYKLFDSRHSINAVLDAVFSKYLLSNRRLLKDFSDLASF